MRSVLAACLMFLGCASAQLAGQDRAYSIVWEQTYGRSDVGPSVQWMEGADLNCDSVNGVYSGFLEPKRYNGPLTARCDAGLYWDWLDVAQVAVWPPEPAFRFSTSAYAHELNHARLYRLTGDGDPTHSDPSWQKGGLLERANNALKAAGL